MPITTEARTITEFRDELATHFETMADRSISGSTAKTRAYEEGINAAHRVAASFLRNLIITHETQEPTL